MRTSLRKLQRSAVLRFSTAKTTSSDTRKDAASAVESVIAWLNAAPNAGTERVVALIEACHRISQLVDEIKTSGGPAAWQNPEVNRASLALRIGLGRYKWHPCIDPSMGSGPHFKVAFAIVGVVFDKERASEQNAVQWIVKHIDTVQTVRRCRVATCRRWYYAKTDHQKYCGDSCRQKDAAQGEDFKEKRRIYMRTVYRPKEKERNERAKRLVSPKERGKSK